MSELKRHVYKVKLAKEGEDYKALSVVGILMENIMNIIFRKGCDGWEIVSIVRGSVIDLW